MTAEGLKHIETRPPSLSNPQTILIQSEEQLCVTTKMSMAFIVCLIQPLSIRAEWSPLPKPCYVLNWPQLQTLKISPALVY